MGEEECYPSPAAGEEPQRPAPAPSRLFSPTFHLDSNDDKLERAQARAARAAAVRRQPSARPPPASDDRPDLFDLDQIMELYHNCIKLACENKINQRNTWELGLIDHLSEIIQAESEGQNETNFRKAGCTLETGVKIYSLRVDSTHAEAYKVLGSIHRAGRGDNRENTAEADQHETEQNEGISKKKLERKLSPLSTLESSFEVLNIKKFDVAFTVDPLYHHTSAKFDEGGAKGLLLNNLGVYCGCQVLFDLSELLEKNMTHEIQSNQSELIDLSFDKEYIEQMVVCMLAKNIISPTLKCILNQADEGSHKQPALSLSGADEEVLVDDEAEYIHADLEVNSFDVCGHYNFGHNDFTSVFDDVPTTVDPSFTTKQKENYESIFDEFDLDEQHGTVADILSLGLGLNSKSNSWAGPDHWKFKKTKGRDQILATVSGSEPATGKLNNRRHGLPDICFAKSFDKQTSEIFSPPKNPKSLLLPLNSILNKTKLPEDCHYMPENLVRLFVLPKHMFLGRKGRKSSDDSKQQNQTRDPVAACDSENVTDDSVFDGHDHDDADDPDILVCQSHQVCKADIQYENVSKQVDVHALKANLWNHILGSPNLPEMEHDAKVSFREVLCCFPIDCMGSSSKDLSPHFFFICLLHLANEHGLSITDFPGLDELDIHIPFSALVN